MDIKKLRHYGLVIFIALCPLIYNTTDKFDLRTVQERGFQLLSFCLISLFIGNIWISSFIFLNVFLLLLNDYSVGLPQVLNIFLGSVLFLITRSHFRVNNFVPYAKVLFYLLVFNLFWMILQACGIDPLFIAQNASGNPEVKVTFKDFSGFFGIKMANAMFVAITLPIVASINIWLAPLMIIPLFFCRASIAMLAVFLSMSFFLYHLYRKIFIWFFLLGLFGGMTYAILDLKDDPKTFTARFSAWHSAVNYTFKRPIGYGPDSYRSYTKSKDFLFYADSEYNHAILKKVDDNTALFSYYDMDNGKRYEKNREDVFIKDKQLAWWDNPHNEYIQQLFEYGFIGLFLLIGLLREMYMRFKNSTKSKELIIVTSCIIVYLVCGLGHFPLHLARIGYMFMIFLGAFYALTDEHERL